MKKHYLTIILAVVFLSLVTQSSAYGQTTNDATKTTTAQQNQTKATGKVMDSHGETLPGATVTIKGTKIVELTDVQGNFVLEIPKNTKDPILVFRFIGMAEKEVAYHGLPLNVTMEDNNTIAEVVVTGMFNKPKESYTGAAQIMTSAEIGKAGSRSMISSISNIDPSFNLVANLSTGSDPNALPSINMRGNSSLPMGVKDLSDYERSQINSPLYLLNGFEVPFSRIVDLDDNQVQSIVLLKDASATAVYGSRGTNGVVLVELKQPISGRLTATYNGSLSIEAPQLSSYNLMNAREKLDFEKAAGLYNNANAIEQQYLTDLYNQRNLEVERGVDTYWLKYPIRVGIGTGHSVRVEGGESAFRYSGSISYKNTEGVMKGSNRTTYNGGIQFQYTLNNLKFTNDLQINSLTTNESPYGSFSTYALANSHFSPYDDNGNLKKMLDEVYYVAFGIVSKAYNPLYNASVPSRNGSTQKGIYNNFVIEYDIIPQELSARAGFSYSNQEGRSEQYIPANHTMFDEYIGVDFARKGSYRFEPNYWNKYEGYATVEYRKTMNNVHKLFLGLRGSMAQTSSERFTFDTEGYSIIDMDFLGLAKGYLKEGYPRASESLQRNVGLNFSANYTYNQRYFVDLSGVIEGSSQFGANKRMAPFASAGIGWNLHHEDFLKDNRYIQVARLKASYGITGKQGFAPYQAITTYITQKENYMGWNGVSLLALGNQDLGWEKTYQTNFGAEVEMFDRRLTLGLDVFRKTSANLLTDVNLPTSSGFASFMSNVGEVRNQGFDLKTSFAVIRNRTSGLYWNIGMSATSVKNKIMKISDALNSVNDQTIKDSKRNPSFLFKEGESINTIFAVESKGIDPSNGQEVFVKLDGTETYVWDAKDLIACGVTDPTLWGTISSALRYKGFELVAYFRFTTGGDMYNTTLANKVENINPSMNADKRAYYDRWKQPGDIAQFKSLADRTTTNATTRFVMQDRSFTGQSLSLSYIVPREWINKYISCESLTLTANTENFFYIGTIKQERGTEYPYAKMYTFKVSARF